MGYKDALESVLIRFPSVIRPQKHIPFKEKIYWTGGVLILYFALTNITIFGVNVQGDLFGQFRSILAGAQGSILHLGIGPIVTASIILQLLEGGDMLPIDTDTQRGQVLYQGTQKVLVVVMSVLTAAPMVLTGFMQPVPVLGLSSGAVAWIVFLQIVLGGVLILYLDEIISKWGIGSGVGLFIVAGVSQQLIGGLLDWTASATQGQLAGLPTGVLFRWFEIFSGGYQPNFALASPDGFWFLLTYGAQILFVFTTLLIIGVVVYAESTRVEIPLSHQRISGARGRYPVKLIYASVIPLIFVRALQANIQLFGQLIYQQGFQPTWFATYTQGTATSGLMYYLSPINGPLEWMWWLPVGPSAQDPLSILLRILIDLVFVIGGSIIFSVFWVETASMGPDAVASQIENSGMQIPGFRRSPGAIQKVMARYIPQITVLGGALLGLLAVLANFLGTIGGVTGTGLLLTISITYRLYEEMAEEQLMNMHPMVRKVLSGDS